MSAASPSPSIPVPETRQVGVKLPPDTLAALSAEAHRLTVERGRSVSVASVIRAAVGAYLARAERARPRVAPSTPSRVGG